MTQYRTIYITFFSKKQATYLISIFNKVLGHGSENWTIRNRILNKLEYGRIMRNIPVLINNRFTDDQLSKINSAVTYAELRFQAYE
jgi:hypothetical protein